MRVALCLSGQPRFVEQAFPNIKKNLIDPNNTDVFVHSWYDESLVGTDFVSYAVNGWGAKDSAATKYEKGIDEKIISLYSPKAFLFERQNKNIDNKIPLETILKSHASCYPRDYFIDAFYSAKLSILKSNTLKEEYRLKNGINYDFVIRARFDSSVSAPIICAEFDPNFLYTDARHSLPPRMIEDWFAFGSNKIMNIYSSAFNFIEFAEEESRKFDDIFCGEVLIYEMMRMAAIKHVRLNGFSHQPFRP